MVVRLDYQFGNQLCNPTAYLTAYEQNRKSHMHTKAIGTRIYTRINSFLAHIPDNLVLVII